MPWENLPRELSSLAAALRKVAETERTGDTLFGLASSFENSWRKRRELRTSQSLPLPPPRDQGLHPQKCKISEASIEFAFVLGENIGAALIPARAEFQVRVAGSAIYENCRVDLEDHWRVDTHVHVEGPQPKEPHATFHFQRGGHAQDAFAGVDTFVPGGALPAREAGNWSALLQSPGPRIPFVPFCPTLAIDFAIGQHDGIVLRRLREVPEYRTLIEQAQTRLWDPFFSGLATREVRKRWLGALVV